MILRSLQQKILIAIENYLASLIEILAHQALSNQTYAPHNPFRESKKATLPFQQRTSTAYRWWPLPANDQRFGDGVTKEDWRSGSIFGTIRAWDIEENFESKELGRTCLLQNWVVAKAFVILTNNRLKRDLSRLLLVCFMALEGGSASR